MVAATSVSLEALAGAVYFISLVIVLWACSTCSAAQESAEPIQKLGWSIALVIGWLLPFGSLARASGSPTSARCDGASTPGPQLPSKPPGRPGRPRRRTARTGSGPPAGWYPDPRESGGPLVGRGRLDPAHAGVGPDQSSASSGFANRAGGRAPL